MQSSEYPDLLFVAPRAWGSGRAGYGVQYLVVHYTAGSERSTSAEDGAAYDQRRTDGTSTHYFVDSDSVVQCVYTWDRANSAFQYGNRLGIQYELCGTQQTRAHWLDPASDATLWNAARQMARDCAKYGLPVRRLTTTQMRNGEKGICGHVDVTNAYGLGDHTDPGPEFPWDVLLERVTLSLGGNDMGTLDGVQKEQLDNLEKLRQALTIGDTHVRGVFVWTGPGTTQGRREDQPIGLYAAVADHIPPATVTMTAQDKADLIAGFEAAAEAAVRKVLGAVDGSSPA